MIVPHSPPLVASPILQLVSKPVKDFLTRIGLKSTKATWNMVLASHHCLMGRTTHIVRSACRHIFRVLGTTSGKSASMLLSTLRVLGSLRLKRSSMIRTTKLATLCSHASCWVSLSELDIWLRLMRSGPSSRNSLGAMIM